MKLKDAIANLRTLEQRLSDPAPFYAEHRQEWELLAQQTARATLVALRPSEIEPETWQLASETFVEKIAAQMLAEGDAGVIIRASELAAAEEGSPQSYQIDGLAVHDVERWVHESRAGTLDEGIGKRLGSIDEGKTDLQVAWRILYALKLGKPGAPGLAAAIRKFLGSEAQSALEQAASAVLAAWVEVFAVRAMDDWRRWIIRQTAESLR